MEENQVVMVEEEERKACPVGANKFVVGAIIVGAVVGTVTILGKVVQKFRAKKAKVILEEESKPKTKKVKAPEVAE